MNDLDDLYQEIILEHYRKPHNFHLLMNANRTADGFNPLCGDMITLHLNVDENGLISDVGFQGTGCAISKASASMMTDSIKGKTDTEAKQLSELFRKMITRAPGEDYVADGLEDLDMLAGVAEFPIRVKCATLSWHTLLAALNEQQESVKTE